MNFSSLQLDIMYILLQKCIWDDAYVQDMLNCHDLFLPGSHFIEPQTTGHADFRQRSPNPKIEL
jgi:hypothetical protein